MPLPATALRPDTYSFSSALHMLHLGLCVKRYGWRGDVYLKITGGELHMHGIISGPAVCVLAGDSILADDWCTYVPVLSRQN